jgi:dephospho-CoA kinase
MVKVIGITGRMGAGKDVVAKYLVSNYGYTQITIGDVVREAMKKNNIEITRENSDKFSQEMRDNFGADYWVKQCAKKIINSKLDKAVIDGIRLVSDNKLMKDSFGKDYLFLLVDVKPEIRFKRLQDRARADSPKDLENFKELEESHEKMFKLDDTFKLADAKVSNNSDLKALYSSIEGVAKKYKAWF